MEDGGESVWQRLGVAAEVEIHIEKKLPVQGGMGAGSANAAAALIGLERELGVALPGVERLKLAAEVGSDVPLFLIGGAVLGLGTGGVGGSDAGFAADLVCGGGSGGGGFDSGGFPGLGCVGGWKNRLRGIGHSEPAYN